VGLPERTAWRGYRTDIADPASVEQAVHAATMNHGRIDILVNCAAIDAKFDSTAAGAVSAALHDMPVELWQRSVDVNVTGLFLMTRRVLQQMLSQCSGNIINVASVYSLVAPDQTLYGDPDTPGFRPKPVDYVATKSVVPNLTRYIATTYARYGIRSNTIVPHAIETDHDVSFKQRFARRSPMGRMCKLQEIGPPVLLLASDASSYMNGSTLIVDGGWTAW
jgi:NAD(P)-dependent dehydrogenase (short-subunit alcohol dehydrogenase family)